MLLALAVPASASAHAVITISDGTLQYFSEDTGSASRLEVRVSGLSVGIYDPGTFGGMQAPFSCRPGRTDARGQIAEYTCPAGGLQQLRVFVEGDEDHVDIAGPLRRYVDGGYGADRIRTGDGPAEVLAGPGNDDIATGLADDLVTPGPGADVLDTGAGADRVDSADGERDRIRCGDGADTVAADTVDEVDGSCESVTRRLLAPPAASAEGDTTAPRLAVRAASRQRASAVSLTASASEAGTISVSAYLAAGGIRSRIAVLERAVRAGRRTRLPLRLTARQRSRVRRDLARGRRPFVAVRVAATDRAGNAGRVRSLRIRLRP